MKKPKRTPHAFGLTVSTETRLQSAYSVFEPYGHIKLNQFVRILFMRGLSEMELELKTKGDTNLISFCDAHGIPDPEKNTGIADAWGNYFNGIERDGNVLYPHFVSGSKDILPTLPPKFGNSKEGG